MHLYVLYLVSAMATLADLVENRVRQVVVLIAIIRDGQSPSDKLCGHLVVHGKTVWRLIQQRWAI